MNKRQFLAAAGAAAGAPLTAHAAMRTHGPALLTITGAITRGNRGPLDPALDQMMAKQKLGFTSAYTYDFAALLALPAKTIRPTLEYDGKRHLLRGPLLTEVLAQTGVRRDGNIRAVLRAVDGYAAAVPLSQVNSHGYIVATHLDGQPMALGGLGPLWAVYDADRVPEMAARPLQERFGFCPWALYHIELQA